MADDPKKNLSHDKTTPGLQVVALTDAQHAANPPAVTFDLSERTEALFLLADAGRVRRVLEKIGEVRAKYAEAIPPNLKPEEKKAKGEKANESLALWHRWYHGSGAGPKDEAFQLGRATLAGLRREIERVNSILPSTTEKIADLDLDAYESEIHEARDLAREAFDLAVENAARLDLVIAVVTSESDGARVRAVADLLKREETVFPRHDHGDSRPTPPPRIEPDESRAGSLSTGAPRASAHSDFPGG
jgi:hypothetical protein